MRIVIALIVATMAMGCTDEDAATETLKSNGFEAIELTGWSPFACSQDDFSSTGFRAKNARGEVVEGVVCCGLVMKSCTVRW